MKPLHGNGVKFYCEGVGHSSYTTTSREFLQEDLNGCWLCEVHTCFDREWRIYRFYRMLINGLLLCGIEVVMWGAIFLCAARWLRVGASNSQVKSYH